MGTAGGLSFNMALENILLALELAMKNEFSRISQSMLKDRQVQSTLTAYFVEKEKRQEVISAIIAPELMQDYLDLSLKEREELGLFHKKFPDYLLGKGDEQSSREIKNRNIRRVVQANHWAYQLLQVFDYYRRNGSSAIFGVGYLTEDKEANKSINNVPRNLFQNVNNNFRNEGGMRYIVKLAARENPGILEHWRQRESMDIKEIVEAYIKFNPSSEDQGPRSLYAFFNEYDARTGERIRFGSSRVSIEDKKRVVHGRRYTSGKFRKECREKGLSFEEFIKAFISDNFYAKLMQTPYYAKRAFGIEAIVNSYIENQPRSRRGYASLTHYFTCYVLEEKTSHTIKRGKGTGTRFYMQFREDKKHNQSLSFEDFIKQHISPEHYGKLMRTAYCTNDRMPIEDIVRSYILHQPATRTGPISPKRFFSSYDATTGERVVVDTGGKKKRRGGIPQGYKYLIAFYQSKLPVGKTFEDYIRERIPEELYQQMAKTTYYQKHDTRNNA